MLCFDREDRRRGRERGRAERGRVGKSRDGEGWREGGREKGGEGVSWEREREEGKEGERGGGR